ncbi:MAG: ATP phosphoribosyltransferase regulatory subunit, partial [Desulfohalobiaceae bacterium]|nr:ATP phosphoribosyltransferase regulatory subunit [Desulfohalobiaceae bacterium]
VVKDLLSRSGVEYRINSNLVRGLDYYQRTTFEVISRDIGSQSAVAGGGRYDGLLKDLGGPDLPGIGFACGLERLVMLLGGNEPGGYDFYVAVLAPEAKEAGLLLACELRDRGLTGETGFEVKSLKSQLRLANKHLASKCLILGQDEMAGSTVLVKDMQTGEQAQVPRDDVLSIFADSQ